MTSVANEPRHRTDRILRRLGTVLLVVLMSAVSTAGMAWPAPSSTTAAGVRAASDTGTVLGTVTTVGTEAGIPGAWITVLKARDLGLVEVAVADGAGRFEVAVDDGSYYLYLIDPAGEHAPGFWGAPERIRVTSGAVTTVEPELAPATGTVTGVVSDAVSGAPIPGAWAVALSAAGVPEIATRTDTAGRFSLVGMRPGGHRVVYLDPTGSHASGFYADAPAAAGPTEVLVTAGVTSNADVSLARQSLSGNLTSLRGALRESGTGLALPGMLVVAYRADSLRVAGASLTTSTGRFRVDAPAGGYRLAFVDPAGHHVMEWYRDRPYDDLAGSIVVSAPSSGISATLTRATGDLEGRVVDQGTGAPIAGAWVVALSATGDLRGVVTDADGRYQASGLPVGTYRAAVIDTQGRRALEYWNDSPNYSGADTFTITAAGSTGVDAVMNEPTAVSLLDEAVGWWSAASGIAADGSLPDLTGNGNDLALRAGTTPASGPVFVAPDPLRGRNLFSPGWDDMYLDTPDPATAVRGVDVAWEGDLGRALVIDSGEEVNWIAHQGSDAEGSFSWAVGIVVETGQVRVVRSVDGHTLDTITSSVAVPTGNQRGAVTVDPTTGDLVLYRQDFTAAIDHFDRPYTDPSWQVLEVVPGAGPLALFDSTAPIRHSSSMAPDLLAGDRTEGWFQALYRLRLRDAPHGAEIARLDVRDIAPEPTWYVETGLPPLGYVDRAKVTDFPGRAGETWTIHNYLTTSYPIVVVDHPAVVFGNGSHAEVPVDDAAFDLADDTDLSVWVVYSTPRVGGLSTNWPLVAFKDRATVDAGWRIAGVTSADVGARAVVADGSSVVSSDPPPVADGATTISGFQVDASARTLQTYTNGSSVRGPTSLGAMGSMSSPGTRLRVAAYSDDGHPTASFAFLGLAVFRRTLTTDEIARLPEAFGLTDTLG